MALPEYPRPAQFRGDVSAWIVNISAIVNNMLRGRQNIVGEVMLVADDEQDFTDVIDGRCHKYSSISFDPLSPSAAELLATGLIYVPAESRLQGSFTIKHPAISLGSEVSFYYTIQG